MKKSFFKNVNFLFAVNESHLQFCDDPIEFSRIIQQLIFNIFHKIF